MIACPRCSYENKDSAMNCASCGINLQWALENPQNASLHELHSVERPPPVVQAENLVVRVFLFIVLLLAVPVSAFLAFSSSWNAATSGDSYRSGHGAAAWFWVAVGVVCILASIAVLLPRRLRPRYYHGLRILGLVALAGALLYGLMRLTLVILPEHTGHSLLIQYKLGERDFSGVNLEGADLRGAELGKANLSGANLGRADLREASFGTLRGADLSGADLSGAILSRGDLSEAKLYETDLSGAYLVRTNLRGADLREANLSDADLRGADLRGAAVADEQLAEAGSLKGTILPDGSVHE